MRIEMVELNNVRLAVQLRGDGAPTVVFVSGLGEPGRVWDPVVRRVAVGTCVLTTTAPASVTAARSPRSRRRSRDR